MLLLLCCSSCDEDDPPLVPVVDPTMAKSRTVLMYVVAENTLSAFCNNDLNEIVRGVKNSDLRDGDELLLYVDDTQKPRIYSLNNKTTEVNIQEIEPEKTFDEDCNSASAEQLGMVIDYMKQKHEAESYGLVMWSHASGWIPSTFDGDMQTGPRRSFGVDNGKNQAFSNNGNQMEISDMAKAIESRCKFDFIFFDACFMQCIEVAYELRNCARYIVASPAEIPGPGADYSVMMKPMFKADDYARQMVDTYYDTYYDNEKDIYKYVGGFSYGVIVSAIDLSTIDDFAAYMKGICDSNREALSNIKPSEQMCYFNYKNYYKSPMPDYMDMKGIMANVLQGVDYVEWKNEFKKVVVANRFTPKWISIFESDAVVIPDYCGGMSMFVPLEGRYRKDAGNYVELIQDTQWGRMMWGM